MAGEGLRQVCFPRILTHRVPSLPSPLGVLVLSAAAGVEGESPHTYSNVSLPLAPTAPGSSTERSGSTNPTGLEIQVPLFLTKHFTFLLV